MKISLLRSVCSSVCRAACSGHWEPGESCWQDLPGCRGNGVDWASWIGRGASPSRETKRQLIRGKGEGRAWGLSPLWSRKPTARLTRQKWAPEFLLWGRDGSVQIRNTELTMGRGWESPGWAVVVTVLEGWEGSRAQTLWPVLCQGEGLPLELCSSSLAVG